MQIDAENHSNLQKIYYYSRSNNIDNILFSIPNGIYVRPIKLDNNVIIYILRNEEYIQNNQCILYWPHFNWKSFRMQIEQFIVNIYQCYKIT